MLTPSSRPAEGRVGEIEKGCKNRHNLLRGSKSYHAFTQRSAPAPSNAGLSDSIPLGLGTEIERTRRRVALTADRTCRSWLCSWQSQIADSKAARAESQNKLVVGTASRGCRTRPTTLGNFGAAQREPRPTGSTALSSHPMGARLLALPPCSPDKSHSSR